MSKARLKFGVLIPNLLVSGAAATTPLIADFMKAFPDASPTTIMQIASLPSLLIMIVAPVYGKLSQTKPKKGLLAFACACFLIGGVGPTFLNSIYPILALRALLGVGLGFIMPMVSDLVTDFYEGHERETMMGLQSGIASLGGILFQMFGAYLGKINLSYCFYTYLVVIVIFGLTMVTLEEPPKRVAGPGAKAKLPGSTYISLFFFFLYFMFWFTLITNTAVMVVGEGLGEAPSVGAILSTMTVGMLLGGFSLGSIMKVVKSQTMALGYLITSIGFAFAFYSSNLSMVYVGGFLMGYGLGVTVPAFWVKISTSVPPPVIGMGIALGVTAMNLGNFLQPVIFEYLLKLLHLNIGRQAFGVSMAALLAMAIATALANAFSGRQIIAEEQA